MQTLYLLALDPVGRRTTRDQHSYGVPAGAIVCVTRWSRCFKGVRAGEALRGCSKGTSKAASITSTMTGCSGMSRRTRTVLRKWLYSRVL